MSRLSPPLRLRDQRFVVDRVARWGPVSSLAVWPASTKIIVEDWTSLEPRAVHATARPERPC